MCKVPHDSPIRVLNADMFATPSMTFNLPSYAADLAHLMVEAPSPPPKRTRPFNDLVFNLLDIEALQAEASDGHSSPRSGSAIL